MRILALTLTVAGILAALGASTAQGTTPGTNGRIVFAAQVGDHMQLFTAEPDGSGLHQITHFANSDSVNPSWSANGDKIVFERDAPSGVSIYTIKPDGSGLRLVLRGKMGGRSVFNGDPALSPNGKRIVFDRQVCFTSNCGGLADHNELWIVNANGTHLRRLTPRLASGPNGDHAYAKPEFSPNGKRISYVLARGDTKTAVFVIGANGHGRKRLTSYSLGVGDPSRVDWSPDGSRILFSGSGTSGRAGATIFTVRPNGTGLTKITYQGAAGLLYAMSWSPDGKQILILLSGPDTSGLEVMNRDGSNVKQITNGLGVDTASWDTHP